MRIKITSTALKASCNLGGGVSNYSVIRVLENVDCKAQDGACVAEDRKGKGGAHRRCTVSSWYSWSLSFQLIPLLLQLTSRLQGVRALGQTASDSSGSEDMKRQTKKQKTRRT